MMKVSIDLSTGLLIESQAESADDAVLLENAANSGYLNVQISLVTEAEHSALITARDLAHKTSIQLASEKAEVLEEAREMRSEIMNALNGIAQWDIAPSDTVALAAIAAARVSLKDLPLDAAVVAATTATATHAAVMAAWKTIAATLESASPVAAAAFKKTAMW